jgi:hypothetical protein
VTTFGFPVPEILVIYGLPDGLQFRDNRDGTATLYGTPAPGSGGIHLTGLEAVSRYFEEAPGLQTVAVQILEAPTFTSATSATFEAGIFGSASVESSRAWRSCSRNACYRVQNPERTSDEDVTTLC